MRVRGFWGCCETLNATTVTEADLTVTAVSCCISKAARDIEL